MEPISNFNCRTNNFAAVNAYYPLRQVSFHLLDGMGFLTRPVILELQHFRAPSITEDWKDDNSGVHSVLPAGGIIQCTLPGEKKGRRIRSNNSICPCPTHEYGQQPKMGIGRATYRVVLHELGGHGVSSNNHVKLSANILFSHSGRGRRLASHPKNGCGKPGYPIVFRTLSPGVNIGPPP